MTVSPYNMMTRPRHDPRDWPDTKITLRIRNTCNLHIHQYWEFSGTEETLPPYRERGETMPKTVRIFALISMNKRIVTNDVFFACKRIKELFFIYSKEYKNAKDHILWKYLDINSAYIRQCQTEPCRKITLPFWSWYNLEFYARQLWIIPGSYIFISLIIQTAKQPPLLQPIE